MATRSVIVRLEAQVAGYVAGLGRAATETDNLAKKAAQARNSVRDNGQAMQTAGTAFVAFGAVTVGALGAATKAALSWESAWAGVTKTVNGSPEQMNALEQSLRGLAKTLPASQEEIAGVAEAAGALGVAREDIVGFTRTMIDLGETTNLTSDEAATSIAQIANVTGLLEREGAAGVQKFGSALVALGNDGASTEAEILSMAQRIAGAAVQIGLSEGEILGVASALSSVGIEAEAGGSAISTVMINIAAAVDKGGADLEKWAGAAGMSGAQFKKAFEEDAAGALVSLVSGLGNAEAQGMTTLGMLEELGITEIRTRDAMLRLAASGDLLADSFRTGNQAFEENTALAEEAAKRYETTEAKIQIAWNNIKDAGIDAGGALLPVVASIAEGAVAVAEAFGALPAPVQGFISIAALAVGGSALLAGGLLKVIPQIADTRQAFRDLNTSGSKVPGVIGSIGKAAAVAAVGFTVLATAGKAWVDATANGMTQTSSDKFTNALIGISKNADGAGASLDAVFNGVLKTNLIQGGTTDVNSFADALSRIEKGSWQDNMSDFGNGLVGATSGADAARTAMDNLDSALAGLSSSGNQADAVASFQEMMNQAESLGVPVEDLVKLFPKYQDAIANAATQNGITGLSQQELVDAMSGTGPAAESAAKSIDVEAAAAEAAAVATEAMQEALADVGLAADGTITSLQTFIGVLQEAGLIQLSANDAARNYEAAIDAIGPGIDALITKYGGMGGALDAAGAAFDRTTAVGRDAEAMFDDLAKAGASNVQAMADNGASQFELQTAMRGTYDSLIVAAGQLGVTGEAADALARKAMGVPGEVNIDTWISDAARQGAEATTGAALAVPDMVMIESSMSAAAKETADATKKSAEDIPNQETIDSWMSDAAFLEAVRTKAAALGIPESEAIDSFMSSAARNEADNTTARILNIPEGASVSAYMDAYIRDMAAQSKAALDAIDGRTVNSYANLYNTTYNKIIDSRARAVDTEASDQGYSSGGGVGGLALGGRIPRLAVGGRLPTTGPGTDRTDGILGLSSITGAPVSWLDGGEQITSRAMTDKHSSLLWAIHRDDPRLSALPTFANGGRMSREYAPAPMQIQATGSVTAGPMQMVGQLVMDSGEILGTFRGIATQAADTAIKQASAKTRYKRAGA